ncbi:MAG: hypothetical protein QOC62_1307 [Mycobacterium sp.]|nr:hypothetical protein [Mycobacterium sp.]
MLEGGVGALCSPGERASRDKMTVARFRSHPASRTSDWKLKFGRSEEMT